MDCCLKHLHGYFPFQPLHVNPLVAEQYVGIPPNQ
jgi:hypothetical protein